MAKAAFSIWKNDLQHSRPYHDVISSACNKWFTAAFLGMSINFLVTGHSLAASDIDSSLHSSVIPAGPSAVEVWHLPNGDVELSNTISNFKSFSLKNPVLLGSGGGGAVFSTDAHDGTNSQQKIAIKVSWVGSANSVKNECEILQRLEENQTRNVERCLGMEVYPQDLRRIMIALEPVVDDAIANIAGETREVQEKVTQGIVRTMVDMLVANIVTTDVQLLINRETGSVLFIDMTEAKEMSNPPTFLDLALASSFISEIVSLIPETVASMASKTLLEELILVETKGIHLSKEIYDILGAQDMLMSPEDVAQYINSRR